MKESTLHHLALATRNLQKLTEFYLQIPGLKFREWQLDDAGQRRSAWFECGNIIVMLERASQSAAPRALVFSAAGVGVGAVEIFLRTLPPAARLKPSRYTAYFRDPDGNTLGFSTYPEPWPADPDG